MPEFFVPTATSPEQAEQVWQTTKAFSEEQTGWEVTDRRIFRVEFEHNAKQLVAEVGEPDPLEGEVVLVILESNAILVCTENRGAARGFPMLADPTAITDFD